MDFTLNRLRSPMALLFVNLDKQKFVAPYPRSQLVLHLA